MFSNWFQILIWCKFKLVDDWQVSDKADKPQKWHGRINNNIAQNAERLHSNKRTVFEV